MESGTLPPQRFVDGSWGQLNHKLPPWDREVVKVKAHEGRGHIKTIRDNDTSVPSVWAPSDDFPLQLTYQLKHY